MPECGIFDHGEVEYTGIWYIISPWENISIMVEYTGIWDTIGPWLEKITQGRIYRNMVYYSTLVKKNQSWSNIPECGVFDHGNVEYTRMWYIRSW